MSQWYRTGSASVLNGSEAVYGIGTAWNSNTQAGDAISFDDGEKWYEVADVADNQNLTLSTPYAETGVSMGGYAIQRTSPLWSLASTLATRIGALLDSVDDDIAAALQAASDGTEALPSIAFANDPDTGFYLEGPNQVGLSLGGSLAYLFTGTALLPGDATAIDLGSSALPFKDLYIGPSHAINFGSDVTVTHLVGTYGGLTFAGAGDGYKFDAAVMPTVASGMDLGSASLPWAAAFIGPMTIYGSADYDIGYFAGAANGYVFDAAIGVGGAVPSGAWLALAAGTASLASLLLASGSALTVPVSGAREFDGKAYYSTNATGRGLDLSIHEIVLGADTAGTNVNTAQNLFGSGNSTITLQANTSYEFEIEWVMTRAAGTTAHTTSFLLAGTATIASILYKSWLSAATGNALATPQEGHSIAATATVISASNNSATENCRVFIRGYLRTGTGGTIIPQFQYSAAPGGAPTILKNSRMKIWALGTDSFASVGPNS